MPLSKAKKKSEVNKTISKNISELTHKGTKKRSREQIIAIAIRAAKGK
jgi:hypothetical protein